MFQVVQFQADNHCYVQPEPETLQMPFTPAHTALVLPFLRSKYCSATALIIGSMAPDFEYFFTMNDKSSHGHTFAGIFYFDIPVVIFIGFVFHRFVKVNLINNLPAFLQRKLNDLKRFQYEHYLKGHWPAFIGSAIIGSMSHLLWDSFTHPDTFIVNNFEIYKTIVPLHGARYPLYYALQVASSYIGLFIVILYILFKPQEKEAIVIKPTILYWCIVIFIGLLIFFIRFYWLPRQLNLVVGVISSITALSVALVIAGRIPFRQLIIEDNG
jgi:hypothetical protein